MGEGTPGNVNVGTAKLGEVTFTADSISAADENILPGWTSGAKKVTVTYAESDYPIDYECYLNVTSTEITDMTLTLSGDNAFTENNNAKVTQAAMKIADGTINGGESKELQYTLTFPETNVDQNAQQGKSLEATVSCKLKGDIIYYNSTNTGGTTEKPTAPAD